MNDALDWDGFAASYSRQVWLERNAVGLLVELLAPEAGERLLDLGTGPGVVLDALARREPVLREVVGIDSAPEMLRQAPELPDGWRVELGDAGALDHEDAGFDLVSASYLLHVLDAGERDRVLAEAARVLRPGGRIGAVTVAPPATRIGAFVTAPLRHAAERSDGRFAGLRPLDPAADLERAGLTVTASKRCLRGYPSLVVIARKPAA